MFTKRKELGLLDLALNRAVRELDRHEMDSDGYAKILDIVFTLHKMKQEDLPSSVSKDTLAVVGANLLGIFMIIQHERVNVITTRAMNLVMKPR